MVKFLILVSGYNCQKYAIGCLQSIEAQTYKNYSVSILNDGSTDQTHWKIYNFIKERNYPNWFFVDSIKNKGIIQARSIAAANATHRNTDFDVIVWVDLDDQIKPTALERLAKEYEDPECWLTYGNYVDSFGKTYYDQTNISLSDEPVREQPWRFIPLRSFRKELYFKLTKEDLFPKIAAVYPDANVLYCLLELAGNEHIRPITDVLYDYNCSNPLNVTKRFPEAQRDAELNFIKSLTPKEKLQCL